MVSFLRKFKFFVNNKMVIVDKKYFRIEEEKKPLLEKYFNKELKLTEQFNKVDYIGEDIEIELKTRNNFSYTYKDTMIGMDKINHLLKSENNGYAVFNFKDGLFYMLINKENVEKCNINCKGGRTDRGLSEIKENGYCYIPIKLLIKISFHIDFN